jgi:O-antigen/teichoic acid export membrane protein
MAYLSWLMLLAGATRWPGMTDTFNACLQGLQRFNKAQVLSFLANYVIRIFTTGGLFLLGRWWGSNTPQIGELMGLSIGATLAAYSNDLIAMFIGARYFNQVSKEFGFKVRDCFKPSFDFAIAKQCILFGIQVSIGPLIGTGTGFIINLYWILLVPQYGLWSQFNGIAGGIANVVQWGTGLTMVPAIAEAFLNGKKDLAQYYIAQSWRWNFFLAFPLVTMLGVYLPIIIQVLLTLANLPIYVLAMSFLLPSIIAKFIDPISSFADQIIVASNNQKFLSYARTCEEVGKLGIMTLFIPILHLTGYGMQSIMWILPLGSYPATIVKTIVSWWYINKKIVPVKFPWGQALIAPLAASGSVMGASYLYLGLVWPALVSAWGILVAAIVTVAWMLIGTFTIYMFFYGFFGGFDNAGLQVFMEAVNIAGPSKNLMKFLAFFVKLGIRISPFYGKFVIKDEVAHRQALELMYEREQIDKKINEEKNGE